METQKKVKEDWEGGDDEDVVCLCMKSSKKSPTSLIDHLIKTSSMNKEIERSRAKYFTQKWIQCFYKINQKMQGETVQPWMEKLLNGEASRDADVMHSFKIHFYSRSLSSSQWEEGTESNTLIAQWAASVSPWEPGLYLQKIKDHVK